MSTFVLRHIDADLWARVRAKAQAHGLTLKAVIEQLLREWVNR
jgi:predicted HicB family RNase H-like nuclease